MDMNKRGSIILLQFINNNYNLSFSFIKAISLDRLLHPSLMSSGEEHKRQGKKTNIAQEKWITSRCSFSRFQKRTLTVQSKMC